MMVKLFVYFIVFLFIFSFKVPFILNSSALCLILIAPFLLLRGVRRNVFILFKNKIVVLMFCFLFILFFITSFITTAHAQYDYSFAERFIIQSIYLFCSIFFISFISYLGNKIGEDNLFEVGIIYAFLAQSVIIIFAFANPSVKDLIQIFQSEEVINISNQYSGIRGLALAGAQFFGLAVGYSIALMLSTLLFLNNKISTTLYVVCYVFFTIAILSIGRTGLVGVAFSFIFFLSIINSFSMFKKFIQMTSYLIIFVLFIALLGYLLLNDTQKVIIFDQLIPFAFEFIYSYLDSGVFRTSSTDILQSMYFPIEQLTFLFGDGVFTNIDGSYYKNTDAGYMRALLFGGITCLLFLCIFQIYILIQLYKYMKEENLRKIKMFIVLLAVLLFIFQYKGDVISLLTISQIMLFSLTLSFILKKARRLCKI